MNDTRKCFACQEVKPLEAFGLSPGSTGGHHYMCKECKAADMRNRRKDIPAEDKAEAMRAYRAGIRRGKCAICGSAIEEYGICDACGDAVSALGGLDGLKQAVRAVRYLQGK